MLRGELTCPVSPLASPGGDLRLSSPTGAQWLQMPPMLLVTLPPLWGSQTLERRAATLCCGSPGVQGWQ